MESNQESNQQSAELLLLVLLGVIFFPIILFHAIAVALNF
jgi:hypothetical protein